MSAVALTPKDLEVMPEEKRHRIEAMLRKYYVPRVGFVDLNWSAVASAMDQYPDTRHTPEVLAWLHETFPAWTITLSEDKLSVRFDGRK